MRWPVGLFVGLFVAWSATASAARLELAVSGEMIEATVVDQPKVEPLFLRDVKSGQRVPASATEEQGKNLRATFELDVLPNDGKPHELALEWGHEELARATVLLPGMDEASSLRWLVIIGPLMGLAMIGIAIWIGRKTLRRVMASEPRRRPFQ